MNKNFCVAVFLAGLIAVGWVSVGYIGSNPLALTMTAIIGVVYAMGALELRRFHQATSTLPRALAAIPEDLSSLGDWLDKVHPSLQNAVRLRIEGERVGLPGPAVTPYLVGLLVMLGMLGTFLGMVVTLNGAVIALESSTDLQTIRAALAAPVKGLGLSFGTSLAGVAASAMLGLLSALCRRDRLQAAQLLDTKIATVLRGFSLVHQRQETFKALQFQAQALPEVVDKLQTMMVQMERQNQQLNERLLSSQESLYGNIKEAYADLATSVDQSLKASLTESARAAGDTIKPVIEATMMGIARETTSLHEKVADTVKEQLDEIVAGFSTTVTTVADTWTQALSHHESTSETLTSSLQTSLEAFTTTFEERSASLLAAVKDNHTALQSDLASSDQQRLAALTQSLEAMAASLRREWQEAGAQALAQQQRISETLDNVSARFGATVTTVANDWTRVLETHKRTSDDLAASLHRSLESFSASFEGRSASLLATVAERLSALQADLASSDQQRLTAFTLSVETMAASLQREWKEATAQAFAQQQQICETLDQTGRNISEQAQAHASSTISEIAKLMQTAAEAPRAAAEVIGQLRQELSNSIARDNGLLEERSRIMETLSTLLDAINHASSEQRGAIDSLVTSSAALLERVSGQFIEKVEAESTKMVNVATQISSGAIEVASLGEALSFAVQLFSESNEKLITNLQRIESSLSQSMARSDDQLAYYVAQAREIIDLSIMSQKQIVEDLQQLSSKQAPLAGEVC